MQRLLVILLVTAAAFAGPSKGPKDIEHPLAAGTPLPIKFTPYWCNKCDPDYLGFEEPRTPVTLLRVTPEKAAESLELDPGWTVIQSPHFTILSTLRKSKIKKKDGAFTIFDLKRLQQIFPKFKIGREGALVNAHQRAHLYQIRLERLYSHFSLLTNNTKPFLGMMRRYEIFLFDDYAEHHALADKYIGRTNDKSGLQEHLRDTHLLTDGSHNYYRETWAWLEEGLAHYYERMENPRHNTFCWTEGKKPDDLLKTDWQSTIFNQVRRKKDTPLSEWCEKLQPGELTAIEHGLCWSLVTYLIENEPARLAKLMTQVDNLDTKPTSAEAIQFAFGISPTVLHKRWRDWVVASGKKKK